MTAASITLSTAFRRIAAAFGNEHAQQKLAQQKRDRSTITLLKVTSLDVDRTFRIPPFESALAGRSSTSLLDVKNMLAPVSVRPLAKASEPAEHLEPRARSRDTLAGARINPTRAAGNGEGGWLHNHWKPSAAGVAALRPQADTTDMHKPDVQAPPASKEDSGAARPFRDAPAPKHAASIETPRTPPKPTVPERSDKVLAHKEAVRADRVTPTRIPAPPPMPTEPISVPSTPNTPMAELLSTLERHALVGMQKLGECETTGTGQGTQRADHVPSSVALRAVRLGAESRQCRPETNAFQKELSDAVAKRRSAIDPGEASEDEADTKEAAAVQSPVVDIGRPKSTFTAVHGPSIPQAAMTSMMMELNKKLEQRFVKSSA